MLSKSKLLKSLTLTDAVFKNICSIEEIPPELKKHFDETFDFKRFEKIAGEMNIKIKGGTSKKLMLQLCQIYCALVNILVKSKNANIKGQKRKNKKKSKNKKGGMHIQDEGGDYLEDRQRGVLENMLGFVKKNWMTISAVLFNMYIIYLAYSDLKRLLDTSITFNSQQFESSGLAVYNEGDNLVSILNADMTELERVSILDLILHYSDVAPKVQTALIKEYTERTEEYLKELRSDARSRAINMRIDLDENIQEGVGINYNDGTVDHLRFLYAAMNPSAAVTKVTDKQITQGRRQLRDFMTGLDRNIEDMRTSLTDYTEDGVRNLIYSIVMDASMLFYSGMFFICLMIRLMPGIFRYFMRRNTNQGREFNAPGMMALGNKKNKSKNPKKKNKSKNPKKKNKSKRIRI